MMTGTICNSSNNNSCAAYNNDTLAQDPTKYLLVVSSVICLLGITGNGLVIWFCLFRMEKTVNVIWFLNLAIADFIFALCLALIIIQAAPTLALENNVHRFSLLIFYLNMSVSGLQLAVISVDRCICVVFPVWCRNHRTRRPALIVVLIIWVITIASHLIILIARDAFSQNIFWIPIARFTFFFLLPFIVIVSSYTVLVFRIKDKSIKSSKPFKVIVAMVIAFIVCWFPYYVFVLLRMSPPRNIHLGMKITTCLMLFNCCINPILYVFIGKDFKQKFCGSFQAIFEKAFREDMCQRNFN